jgi:hypothetical protein
LLIALGVFIMRGAVAGEVTQEPSGSRWVEVGDPRIMVSNGNQGEVKVTSDKGNVYRIQIRPRRM